MTGENVQAMGARRMWIVMLTIWAVLIAGIVCHGVA